ncbi:TlpA disulfide reductase family protein [Lutibacter sp. TH_r2]|uniref:TlpA disulfide reductase family protein n=1 Tax=Lutibacter sp. TH_r2 TaxID=3082083 RepID=UPI0029531BFF|nr:TlpA disulfide reductase family protein [Lutibacter sp. TH_r2]MDV7187677.1 TlpA disulfide reductase family protein [Lutibacter sp. TH_r2]
MKYYGLLFIFLTLFSCKEVPEKEKQVELKKLNFEQFKTYLNKNEDKTFVINFWATWCAPCVKELPYFEEITKTYSKKDVEVILVSLDFPNKVESNLIPFIKKNNLQSEVLLLDAPNENEWIPKVDSTWSGAIPATVIYNKNKRLFYEQSFTKEELFTELNQFIKH